ncbi:MAG: hypothetical protein NDJ75_00635 [Thermoanaerobaculia bacterium]|nr:hypothetical protein [Thermoanaerobaculia bacterium]
MRPVEIDLTAVIAAVTAEAPRVLVARRDGSDEAWLPSGPLDAASDRTLELAVRHWVREQTGVELGYVEQLYTFGNRYRDPRERRGGPRVVSITYLALVREAPVGADATAAWRGWYDYLPWEDWRSGRPAMLDATIVPALERWARGGPARAAAARRRERAEIGFGLRGAPWDPERVLDRYELLYEAGLVAEAWRAGGGRGETTAEEAVSANEDPGVRLGDPLALDHRRILASALGRLRGKLRYRPVVFELLPPAFTLLALQRCVEALAGQRLHKQNFRRLVEGAGLVEGTGRVSHATGGRPAELFRFRREALRERPAPGVGLPRFRRAPG